MHTNPVLISFCSLLYYKSLRYHVHNYKLERKCIEEGLNLNDEFHIEMVSFTGKPIAVIQDNEHKAYNKFIVNKWRVFLMLNYNKTLIKYRKHNLVKEEDKETISVLQKIKACCSKTCHCCHKINLEKPKT